VRGSGGGAAGRSLSRGRPHHPPGFKGLLLYLGTYPQWDVDVACEFQGSWGVSLRFLVSREASAGVEEA
jgi:hypothetical protein